MAGMSIIGDEILRIESSGRLSSPGTTSPNAVLHVKTDPLAQFKARIYDILANQHKIDSSKQGLVGGLSPHISAVYVMLCAAAEQFREDSVVEFAEVGLDGLVATLMTAYNSGLPAGAKAHNPNLQRLLEVLSKAGADARKTE